MQTATQRQCPATYHQLGTIACPDFGQTVVLGSIDVHAACGRHPTGAVAEGVAQAEDMGAPVVAMDLEPCECGLVMGDQRLALNPGEGRGRSLGKYLSQRGVQNERTTRYGI